MYLSNNEVAGTTCRDDVNQTVTVMDSYDDYESEPIEYTTIHEIDTICQNVTLPLNASHNTFCNGCLQTLRIEQSNISVIPPLAFSHEPKVTALFLSDLNISQILPGAFGQTILTLIDLSGNNLSEISLGVFNSLHNLKALVLSKNKLTMLPNHCFTGLTNLEVLDLSYNKLLAFYFAVFDPSLHTMSILDLSYNELLKFEVDVKINISKIVLKNNSLRSMDFCPLMFHQVQMSINKIDQLVSEKCITNETRLIHFDVSFNNIDKIDPTYFENATKLIKLNLNNNNISNLPQEIFSNLNRVQELNISHNSIKTCEFGIFDNLKNIKTVDISNNKLDGYPKSLHSLSTLTKLYLENNGILNIDPKYFDDFPVLKEISLSTMNLSCDNLVDLFRVLKKRNVTIISKAVKNASSVHGIACTNPEEIVSSKLPLYENASNEVLENVFQNYFDSGFKKSNFFKYLNNFQLSNSVANIQQEPFSPTEKSELEEKLEENSKDINDLSYLFRQYLAKENVNKDENNSDESINDVNLGSYLNSLNETIASKLTDNKADEIIDTQANEYEKIIVLLSINTILFIFVCISILVVVVYYIKKPYKSVPQEQVELVSKC
ncbi:leucine-rich repeat-containing G-protein coupled receptor 4-like [Diabrotica virgifera virgifera]|nr:leucine-rich repeat-containing G-protein coupled receptor 4-like [Diabrotica virgifera virgifera]